MQETHSTPACEQVWQNEWGGKAIFAHGTAAARGIALFTSKEIFPSISNISQDINGRYLLFDITDNSETISILAIYAPNQDDPTYFRQLAANLKNRSEKKIIIGDFNLTLDVNLDRLNTYCNNNKALEEVNNIIDEFCLRDTWRDRNQDAAEYSWIKKLVKGENRKASRIDLALISGGLDQKVEMIMYISSIMTDHRALYLVVETSKNERGTGYWKLNTSLLSNQEFVNHMNQELKWCLEATVQSDPILRWEQIKTRVKKAATSFSRKKSSEDKLIMAQLSEKVNCYEQKPSLDQGRR